MIIQGQELNVFIKKFNVYLSQAPGAERDNLVNINNLYQELASYHMMAMAELVVLKNQTLNSDKLKEIKEKELEINIYKELEKRLAFAKSSMDKIVFQNNTESRLV